VGRKFKEHPVKPDSRYNSRLVSLFINYLMLDGKKSISEKNFYKAMDLLAKRHPDVEPIEVFQEAIENVRPHIEVRSRRVGGANYQVPTEIDRKRSTQLALRWIRDHSRARKGKPMSQRLAEELNDAYKRQGGAYHKREQVHRMAEANRAFAHFAW
jgi:small subunit ribosomal protein S7